MLSSSVASGRSFLKVLGVEEEPHLVTVLMEKMSAVKELQTLSEDMSDWLSGSKQGIAALACVLVMCLYYWSLGATDTQFTEKQAFYERIGEICLSIMCSAIDDFGVNSHLVQKRLKRRYYAHFHLNFAQARLLRLHPFGVRLHVRQCLQ